LSAHLRPAWLGGAVHLGPTPQATAQRVLDGLTRGRRAPTGDEIRTAMQHLSAVHGELATAAAAADRAGGAS
jgi:hypothetical protein